MIDNTCEYIICAAIWYNDNIKRANLPVNIETGIVIGGWRHGNCIIPLNTMFPNRDYILNNKDSKTTIQGFITNKGRFVERDQAAIIALTSGQIKEIKGKPFLYSEDIY